MDNLLLSVGHEGDGGGRPDPCYESCLSKRALINGEYQELQIEVGRGRSTRLYIVVVYDPQSTSRVLRIKIQ